jgi:cytochrome c-type biogenesis protein CcmF
MSNSLLSGSSVVTLADFGTAVLYLVLVAAAYTASVAVRAGQGRPKLLQAARLGAYGTSALVLLGVLLLSYAFVSHDFSIRYVARYSDRSTQWWYLLTALWGGQDGSLLWWLFLTSANTAAAVWWLRGRYRQLQPYVITTLMVIIGFFAILMIFAANPFQTYIGGALRDGQGLNALLKNYWMIIHPPALYMGFVACAVPFSFAVAALVTARLDNEWIVAVRKWMLFAWLFLTIGNVLGMVWAYEELGWGGFWGWDPVENAAFLPWLTASAYVHSTIIQERRNMLKLWNVVLIALTFFLTIFGTFLTRSGMIASVHSFAKSDIGIYFVVFMALIVTVTTVLLVWRAPHLRARSHIESVASREAMFVINNWALVALMLFVAISVMFPVITNYFYDEELLLGAPHYNLWAPPIGLLIYALMGLAPLFGWRKTSDAALREAFKWPLAALVIGAVLHIALGGWLGYPPIVESDAPFPGPVGVFMQKLSSAYPIVTVTLSFFNVAVIVQEFVRGVRARQQAALKRKETEGVLVALVRLLDKNRRRYGGYIVHLGIVAAFFGCAGQAWTLDHEVSLQPGERFQLGSYELTYKGSYSCPGSPQCTPEQQADQEKRMIFAPLEVAHRGRPIAPMLPAKFIYNRETTTEVALLRGLAEDLYIALNAVNPGQGRATFDMHVNPFVGWLWIGALIMILGSVLSLWPEAADRPLGAWSYVRAVAATASAVFLGLLLATTPAPQAQAATFSAPQLNAVSD